VFTNLVRVTGARSSGANCLFNGTRGIVDTTFNDNGVDGEDDDDGDDVVVERERDKALAIQLLHATTYYI
jgi:hypothetical protein